MWWLTSNCSPLLIYRPREDERLSWPGWLTYSGRLTHISGQPSATGWVQEGERMLARDWRSTAEPHGPTVAITTQVLVILIFDSDHFLYDFSQHCLGIWWEYVVMCRFLYSSLLFFMNSLVFLLWTLSEIKVMDRWITPACVVCLNLSVCKTSEK